MKRLMVLFGLILAVLMAVSAYAVQVPVTVGEVKVDGYNLDAGLTTSVRQLERGEDFDVKIALKATADVENVQINVFITGFEHSQSEPISDSIRAFDLAENETVVKTLQLSLPERADEDKYLLRIIVSDRSNDVVTKEYGIKVQPSDTQVVIKDFELSPEDEVQAGRAVLATVRVKNVGDSQEDDVKIRVSIPELGVSATPDFINELEEEESATSEEFFLKINSCTKPGIYSVVAEVTFDEGDEKVTEKKAITVTKGICDVAAEDAAGQAEVSGKTTLAYSTEAQSVVAGGSAASYPVTITNSGASTKAFMISVDGADWAGFKVSPSNLVTVKPGQTQTVFVFASANAGTQAGERVFTVSVKDSAGNVLQNLAMKADVVSAGAAGGISGLRNALTAGLVVIVAILVVIGLVLAFRRVKGGEEGESQTYY
ncbi:hypothetical protein J4470_02995 [Candidatus Woesearchaeota archaeon]|nr:hypothetical protein [Candidatus Woesearchaeota archaeon]